MSHQVRNTTLARLVLAALLFLLCAHGPVASLGDWSYVKQAGRSTLVDRDARAAHAAPFAVAAGVAGVDVFGVASATVPPGMRVQMLHARLRSRGFFSAEPGAHLAVGVTGAWRKDNPATPRNDGLLVGRGVIIGNVSAASAGCNAAPVVQIESFRRYGNRLYRGSCSDALHSGVWYQLTVLASRDGRVAYWLSDAEGRPLAYHGVDDAGAQVPAGLGGWWILHVFSNRHPQASWRIDISGLTVQWLRAMPSPP